MSHSRALSLHQLSMMELSPIELVRVAGAAGFDHVCIFTKGVPTLPFPLLTQENKAEMRSAMRDAGVSLYNVELFPLTPEVPVEDHRAALALGAELGGQRATGFFFDELEDSRAIDEFGRFCEIAEQEGLKAGLEFMLFTSVKTIDHAMRIIRGAGHRNGTLAIDALHLMRNGVGPADFDRLGVTTDEIGYIQFCDGPASVDPEYAFIEATANRTPPGHGAFPLGDFLAHMPEGRTMSIECPIERMREAGMSAVDRAKLLYTSTREVLARHEAGAKENVA